MKNNPPKVDERKYSDLYRQLRESVPHYTPQWAATSQDDAGVALLKIFSYLAEQVVSRFNEVPRKSFIGFLDMLGIKLLPARPARVPLTFQLTKGTEKEVLIPARSRAASDKTDLREELPFETEKNLLAIPSALKKAISIDPLNDAIFIPPPGFLVGTLRDKTALSYQIVSSPSAGAKDIQLDHVTDIEEGDFLKIGGGQTTAPLNDSGVCVCHSGSLPTTDMAEEYVVVSAVSGNIVSLTDTLARGYLAGTPVEKVFTFHLLQGKNMQEHSVYIGHKDLFNVKSAAEFVLYATQASGLQSGSSSLELSWEYWGEQKGIDGEAWRKFIASDYTQGLSKEGKIELKKLTEGEIKEVELNGVKSRWLRCKVTEPLPANDTRQLPVLNNLTFQIKSAGEGLPPDKAFNNDVPLDIEQAFAPFGKEPRIFDRFSITNKEVFSKKGAAITLDFDIAARGVLGPPAAISYGRQISVFACGTFGRLMEIQVNAISSIEPSWIDHGFPTDTKLSSEEAVSVVSYMQTANNAGYMSVFVKAENGHLAERFFNGSQWQWIDHAMPAEKVKVAYEPAAIYDSEGAFLSVFVTGSDKSLYEFSRITDTMEGVWIEHGKPNGQSIDFAPHSDSYVPGANIRLKTFVIAKNGALYELDSVMGENSDDRWELYQSPPSVTIESRPLVSAFYNYDSGNPAFDGYFAKVFVKDSDGKLWEFSSLEFLKSGNGWFDLGAPMGVKVKSAPHGLVFEKTADNNLEDKHIFTVTSDKSLWERTDTNWEYHGAPASAKHLLSPYVISSDEKATSLHTFTLSDHHSILERATSDSGEKIWNQYKDPYESSLVPSLSWEYGNKKGWFILNNLKDETNSLLKSGKITFDLPNDIEETDVSGETALWIRARIIGGDYGKESFTVTLKAQGSIPSITTVSTIPSVSTPEYTTTSSKDSIRYPLVNRLTISYEVIEKQFPQYCLSYNNLEYIDQTVPCKNDDKYFVPFEVLDTKEISLFLGFEASFKGGPVKVFFDAKELPYTEARKPKLQWSYSAKNQWKPLSFLDATEGLIKRELLDLLGPTDFAGQSMFGNYQYWIKGGLVEGEYEGAPEIAGIFPNTTWAFQAQSITDEILGSSDGTSDQAFNFFKYPVFEGEEVRVREMLTDEEKQQLMEPLEDQAILEIKDDSGQVIETWVLWQEVSDFFDSSEKSRHYILDRATGEISFGNGTNGMIPPSGDDNIKAMSYQAGGGAQGNVEAGAIKTLKSSLNNVNKVSNPIAADGGADTATVDEMLEIGPAMISHRMRAVTAEDFEWLAKDASRKVVKSKCLPNTNNQITMDKQRVKEIGWVTVVIVPDSKEEKPTPSLELRSSVQKYLESHCVNTLSHQNQVYVTGPFYVDVSVAMNVYAISIDVVSQVERTANSKLSAFFHPLTGGQEGKGWEFGRNVSVSDIYALMEDIEGVDHIENLKITYNGADATDIVPIKENFLVANGTHQIIVQPVSGR
jgi:uncharacterized phage protein gp47/JayE